MDASCYLSCFLFVWNWVEVPWSMGIHSHATSRYYVSACVYGCNWTRLPFLRVLICHYRKKSKTRKHTFLVVMKAISAITVSWLLLFHKIIVHVSKAGHWYWIAGTHVWCQSMCASCDSVLRDIGAEHNPVCFFPSSPPHFLSSSIPHARISTDVIVAWWR